jgi:hypothetical protein
MNGGRVANGVLGTNLSACAKARYKSLAAFVIGGERNACDTL